MAIPQTIPMQPSAAIASYSYTDIAEGTGIQVFYGAITTDSGGQDEILTSQVLYSDEISTSADNNAGGGTYGKKIDLDFDLPAFNMPQNLLGTATFSVSWALTDPSVGTAHAYFIFKIRKWDGTTETDIATVQTETLQWDDGEKTSLLDVAVPLTQFKKGETLRVTVEGWAESSDVSDGTITLAHDPKARTVGTMTTSVLQMNIPFKLKI